MIFGGRKIVLDGEMELLLPESGELGVVTVVHDGAVEPYQGDYIVDPKFYIQTLETENKSMTDNVTVNAIAVTRTTNPSGGITVVVG